MGVKFIFGHIKIVKTEVCIFVYIYVCIHGYI